MNKCFSQKFSNHIKNNIFFEEEPRVNAKEINYKESGNFAKCNEIFDCLSLIYKDRILKELANNSESQELAKLAGTFILELEIFFSTNERI